MVWEEKDVRHHTTCPLPVWSKDLEQNVIWQGPRHVAHDDTKNTFHGSHRAQSIWGKILREILGLKIEGFDNQL
jgi:hypothetical protein